MKRLLLTVSLLLVMSAMPAHSADIPDATAALAAYTAYADDPYNRLDKTQPFLDFIQSSGRVHIVLNDALLAWMYDDLDPHYKAVLYAGFLGGNMAGQLARQSRKARRQRAQKNPKRASLRPCEGSAKRWCFLSITKNPRTEKKTLPPKRRRSCTVVGTCES